MTGFEAGGDAHDRTRRVFGEEAFSKIQNSKVCLLGLGGVGSYCLSSLVRAGVGNVLIIDGDAYDVTNINRQEFAFLSTIGERKVDVAKAYVAEVNPQCTVKTFDELILSGNIGATVDVIESFQPDWIIDAIDAISIKLLLAEHFVRDRDKVWCQCFSTDGNQLSKPLEVSKENVSSKENIDEKSCVSLTEKSGKNTVQVRRLGYISAMGAANKLDPSRIQISSLSKTCNDGLCRIMRKEARKRNIPDFTVCYSDEQTVIQPGQVITRDVEKKILGSVSFIPSIMGITIAGHVIRSIAQK